MKKYNLEDVNKPNSSTWSSCNNDSKSKKYRTEFLTLYGGEFVKDGKYLKWQTIKDPEPVYVPRRLLYFIDPSNNLIAIDHMSDYCIEHKLSKAAMYEVLRGLRNTHKGYRAPPKEPDIVS